MIKTLKAMAIGLPIVAAALVAAPGTANAGLNECPTDRFCAWINDEFSGSMASWSGNSSNWGTMGDNAESMYNRRASSATRVDNVVTYHDVTTGTAVSASTPERPTTSGCGTTATAPTSGSTAADRPSRSPARVACSARVESTTDAACPCLRQEHGQAAEVQVNALDDHIVQS